MTNYIPPSVLTDKVGMCSLCAADRDKDHSQAERAYSH